MTKKTSDNCKISYDTSDEHGSRSHCAVVSFFMLLAFSQSGSHSIGRFMATQEIFISKGGNRFRSIALYVFLDVAIKAQI